MLITIICSMAKKRTKFKRLAEVLDFKNVVDGKNIVLPIALGSKKTRVLELGCGKGAYTVALAQMFPRKDCIGIDVKGERIWIGAKYALDAKLDNVQFIWGRVNALLSYFEPKSVDEIWVTFPDPFPRSKQAKHRLTSPLFLELYKKVLVPGGVVHLKTDDEDLFEYTIETVEQEGGKVLKALANIYQEMNLDSILQIQTDFEKKHLAKGKKIYYLQFFL